MCACAYPARRVAVSLTDGASRCDVDDDPDDRSAQRLATTLPSRVKEAYLLCIAAFLTLDGSTADDTSTRRPETTTAMREYPTSELKVLFQ